MSTDTPSTELENNTYRISVLTHFAGGQEIKTSNIKDPAGVQTVAYEKTKNGLFSVSMRMPDGSIEYWRQTDITVNAGTGFMAMAFERRNADGNVYTAQDKRPQTIITFPGSIGTGKNLETVGKVLNGQDLKYIHDNTDKFVDDLGKHLIERSASRNLALPDIIGGTHSMGANSLGAAPRMRENGLEVRRTIMLEPVGAGQTVHQLIDEIGKKKPTPGQRDVNLSYKVTSISNDDGTLFHANGGKDICDNMEVGETYVYKTNSNLSAKFGYMTDHAASSIANFALQNHGNLLSRRSRNDFPTSFETTQNCRPLTSAEKLWAADIKANLYIETTKAFKILNYTSPKFDLLTNELIVLMNLTGKFNDMAALELHENPKDPKPDFSGLKLEGVPKINENKGPENLRAKPITVASATPQ